MEYQSIFATPPKNEAELTALENEVQKLLLKTLDINITRKRRSEKLREVACVFSGFPNGFQQMQKYWASLRPFVLKEKKDIDCLATLTDGLVVVFCDDEKVNFSAYLAISKGLVEEKMRLTKEGEKATESPLQIAGVGLSKTLQKMLREDPNFICMGTLTDEIDATRAIRTVESGHFVIAMVSAPNSDAALRKIHHLGVSEDFTSQKLYMFDAKAISSQFS